MALHSSQPVVVGIDGFNGPSQAIGFGVQEARRTGSSLRLVHVVPDFTPLTPLLPLLPDDVARTGRGVLQHADQEVHALAPDLDIEVDLRSGARSKGLVEAAQDARLLVLGCDRRPALDRLMTGNTVTAVVSRTRCPVVSVPSDWDPAQEKGVVVVGVKSAQHATQVLGDAFATAESSHARLRVLHAWKLASGYDDIIASRIGVEHWSKHASADLDLMLDEWRTAFPMVDTELEVVHDYPGHALVQASHEADLIVVARREHSVGSAVHLGGAARAVLRASACPVRVVTPAELDTMAGLVLEHGGAIEK